jgi:hypothetical protein
MSLARFSSKFSLRSRASSACSSVVKPDGRHWRLGQIDRSCLTYGADLWGPFAQTEPEALDVRCGLASSESERSTRSAG